MSKRTHSSSNFPPSKRLKTGLRNVPTTRTRSNPLPITRHVKLKTSGQRLGQNRHDRPSISQKTSFAAEDTDAEIHAWVNEEEDEDKVNVPQILLKRKSKKGKSSYDKLYDFLTYRESFLHEMLRHEGHGDSIDLTMCFSCRHQEATFKCRDCFSQLLRCAGCARKEHLNLPLHRILQWNGKFFEKITLKALGLTYQLGHGGGKCPLPSIRPADTIVFDISGVHQVSIEFCDCGHGGVLHDRTQFLRARWLPVTFLRPRTVFTFDVLETFHELTLQGKTTPYDFYHSILRRHDNAELGKKFYRYREFLWAIRIWRHLKMLKRAARGHDPDGPNATKEGELAVECPACPHPKRNLPDDWADVPPFIGWLYTLFVAIDANFRLGLKDKGLRDVELAPGWAYFVEETRFQHHVKTHLDQKEISTCKSQLDAVNRANTRNKEGYISSGTGLGQCARHGLVRKNGVGDLQKGEKYCNMDYIVLSSLIAMGLLRLILSYDIACQWSKNLATQMESYPDSMRINLKEVEVRAAVPGFHIRSHGSDCQQLYSLNLIKWAAQTVGEEVETGWAHMNLAASSIQEMAPGNRHEALNDHWGGWNFRKIITFKTLFTKRFKEAFIMRTKHKELFEKFSATFKSETVNKWEAAVSAWDNDEEVPNPYEEPVNATTERDIRLQLARDEEAEAARGITYPHKTTPSAFLNAGLDIEEQQRALRLQISQYKGHPTRTQLIDVHEKRTTLWRRIKSWRVLQMIYMPCVASLLTSTSNTETPTSASSPPPPSECAEGQPLWLPSALPQTMPSQLSAIGLLPGLREKETKFRIAQADDALAEIRRQRRIVTGLVIFKKLNVSGAGQKKNTRMRTLFKRFNNKTERFAERYRAARSALESLDPDGNWKARLQVLRPEDICGPGREPVDKRERRPEMCEKRREESWIWLVPRVESAPNIGEMEEHLDANLRVEWAKSRAHAARWAKEAELLEEEMRRTIAFLEWKGCWWRSQANRRPNESASLRHGIAAYAERQAALNEKIAYNHATHWLQVLKARGITPCWEIKYGMARRDSHHGNVGDDIVIEEVEGEDEDEDDNEDDRESQGHFYDDFEIDI